MATPKPKRKSGLKRAPAKRTPRKAKPGTRGLSPAECRLDSLPAEAEEVRARVEREGGLVLGAYSDPLGKNALLIAILPIDRIEPTPFSAIFRRPTTGSSPTSSTAPRCFSPR